MNTILGTGLTGLVGSRITELLSGSYLFENISRNTGVDITDNAAVLEKIRASDSNVVLHLAAYTDVEGAEKEKELQEQSMAWKINVLGTKNIVSACRQTGKKLIHISTDMVFPGDISKGTKYAETDETSAVGWYAKTKEEAEKIIEESQISSVILRIAYPYRGNFEKKDYVRIFYWLLQNNREIKAVEDHYFTPTFIDDIATILKKVLDANLEGIFHVVGDQIISPYIAANLVAREFNFNASLISRTTREEFFKGRAPRGFNLSLDNGKIKALGVKLKSFDEGLLAIKTQIERKNL